MNSIRTPLRKAIVRLVKYFWAGPWTLVGLSIGMLGLITGGKAWWRGGVVEFAGGFVTFYLRWFPLIRNAAAVTLGHVILGRSQQALEHSRAHEMVHVAQYERWGPAFVPAYLACWVFFGLCGRNPYYDNPFERQAFRLGGP